MKWYGEIGRQDGKKRAEILNDALRKVILEGGEVFVVTTSVAFAERLATEFFNKIAEQHLCPERLNSFCVKAGRGTVFFRHSSPNADEALRGLRPDAVFSANYWDDLSDAIYFSTQTVREYAESLDRFREAERERMEEEW